MWVARMERAESGIFSCLCHLWGAVGIAPFSCCGEIRPGLALAVFIHYDEDSLEGIPMLHTVEAVIDPQGHVQWLEEIHLRAPQRVLITLLEPLPDETLAMAEPALAKEWLNEEEDAAWAHLQQEA